MTVTFDIDAIPKYLLQFCVQNHIYSSQFLIKRVILMLPAVTAMAKWLLF